MANSIIEETMECVVEILCALYLCCNTVITFTTSTSDQMIKVSLYELYPSFDSTAAPKLAAFLCDRWFTASSSCGCDDVFEFGGVWPVKRKSREMSLFTAYSIAYQEHCNPNIIGAE